MKNHIITALFSILSLIIPIGVFGINIIPLEAEAYVDDIPFNTAALAMIYGECPLPLEVEAEVNDIPFNTAEISARASIPMETELSVAEPSFVETRRTIIHDNVEFEIIIEDFLLNMQDFYHYFIGKKSIQILDDPDEFIEEVGKMVLEELEFLNGYANSLKSF